MRQLPLDFVRCVECGHIYNAAFDYEEVPYSDKPNLMFNQGASWSDYIRELQRRMMASLPANPVVVEIGHGDGSFLAALSEIRPQGTYIGFDPHGATQGTPRVALRAELFHPGEHIPALKPDLIIMRHVLEHFTNPLGFLQQLTFAAAAAGLAPQGYFEVPCVDRVLETGRTVDLYYEHNSQFTTESFTRMLSRCHATPEEIGHGYDGEVVYGFVALTGNKQQLARAEQSLHYAASSEAAQQTIALQLAELAGSGKRVAIWGGTGKSAAFMNYYGADAKRFPLVVDSDPAKAGTFVPGTGQEIQFRDALKAAKIDVVIIPPQWRAGDIIMEMAREGIVPAQVLIEHNLKLTDYHREPHPYAKPAKMSA